MSAIPYHDFLKSTTSATRNTFFMRKYGIQRSSYITERCRAGYMSPEDHYEMLVDSLVTDTTTWLDVGCGRSPFPNNPSLASDLSRRCQRLVGIDPDSGVKDNPYIHEGVQVTLDDYTSADYYDLVTARMVVEHVCKPSHFVRGLTRITRVGSRVAIFTVNWHSITAIAAHFTPTSFHQAIKSRLWGTREEDTFPTAYLMNRRDTLKQEFQSEGFQEEFFEYIADASLLWRLPVLRRWELRYWQLSQALHLPYPDSCILSVYRRIR